MAENQRQFTPLATRPHDIVLLGATGFTGTLIAHHLTTHGPTSLSWTISGRSSSKLNALFEDLKALPGTLNLPTVQSLEDEDLSEMVEKARVAICTIGPYTLHGERFLKACVEKGTSWVDLTGETPWIESMIGKYESLAKQTGSIVSFLPTAFLNSTFNKDKK